MDNSAAPPTDLHQARTNMVECQVRPNKVTDPRILAAMRTLPRERFAPAHLASFAYIDEDLPLGGGRVLMEPMIIARLVQMLRVRPGHRVLVVAAGAGYGAALVAACGADVTALEDDDALAAVAQAVLPVVSPRVTLVRGPLDQGWAASAPYDSILVEGAVRSIPPVLEGQVRAPGGRLVTVMHAQGSTAQAILAEPVGDTGRLRAQPEFDCATPLLPSLLPAAAFVF